MTSEAYIHLRVPAATKGRWVRASRAASLRLSDWIIEALEARMEKIHGNTSKKNAMKGDRPRAGRIQVRVTEDVELAAKEAAAKKGVDMSDYISGLVLRDKS